MKPGIYLILLLVLVFSGGRWPALAEAPKPDPSHWQRALETARHNTCWVPSVLDISETVRDENGRTVERSETRIELVSVAGQVSDMVLVSRTENGQDKTGEYEGEFKAEKNELMEQVRQGDLFVSPEVSHAELTALSVRDTLAEYRFRLPVEDIVLDGLARIDTEKGQVTSAVLTCGRMEDDDVEIRNYKEEIHYRSEPGVWYPMTIVQTMDIKTKSLFFSFKGRVETRISLSGHTCPPAR